MLGASFLFSYLPDMKRTPEPITNIQFFRIILVLLLVGWGIAVLVDSPFVYRFLTWLVGE